MSTKNWSSHSCCRWILLLVYVILSISLLSSCIANNPPSTPSAKPASAPAVELPSLEPEFIPEPETAPEPEPMTEPELVSDKVTEPTSQPEPVSDNVTEPISQPELVSDNITEPISQPKLVSDNITEPTSQAELVSDNVTEPISQPEPAPEPEPEPVLTTGVYERFGFTLERSRLRYGTRALSHLSISRILKAGEAVRGFAEISDPQMETHGTAYIYVWDLEVLDPIGNKIYSWRGRCGSQNHHEFYFRAMVSGEYIVRVGHYGDYEKLLFLKISPVGWDIEHVDGSNARDWD